MSSAVEIHDSFFCRKLEFELCKSILKRGNYNKSRFYEQILKVGTSTFRKFFLIFNHRTHVNFISRKDNSIRSPLLSVTTRSFFGKSLENSL
ncbi:hypothetical protein B1H38_14695 [Leptospira borgpetersenii serovar Ballum]|nr:hypothetical protein B1H38_14695 [Leptospira borgpetersenii serovar Ballum]